MRFRLTAVATLAGPLLLQACGSSDRDAGAGGVSAGEARALNDAAAMLEERANTAAMALNSGNASH